MLTALPDDFEKLKQWKMLLKRVIAKLEHTSVRADEPVGDKHNAFWLRQIGE